MARRRSPALTDGELRIMRVLWHRERATVGEVVEELNDTYGPSRNLSSMYQDLTNGKRTEIDHMNGAVVELGRQYGVACPVNASLVAIIKAMEQGPAVS